MIDPKYKQASDEYASALRRIRLGRHAGKGRDTSAEPKRCPGAHFKYFAHCERCAWSEAIMLDVAAPRPKCEVCGDAMTVFSIGAPLAALPLKPTHEMQGSGFDPGASGYELQGRQHNPGASS